MPKDSNLLSPMSREMLRAARAGCRYIRPTPKFEDDEEKDPGDGDDAVDTISAERSFTARKWAVLPRHVEPPEVEFLAKRRPGLPSLYGAATMKADPSDATTAHPTPPLRKTKIKKIDATSGIATIYEVWVPEGHTLEGEVHESGEPGTETNDGIMIVPTPAPGTVVEGVGVVNAQGNLVVGVDANAAPAKRRPPPPKRKGRGFGSRGRRKKVMFAHGDGSEQQQTPAGSAVEGNPPAAGDTQPSLAVPGENLEASQMTVDSAAATPENRTAGEDEEGNEEDEESEEGEEGEEVEEGGELREGTKSPGTAVTNPPSGTEEANSKPKQEAGQDTSEQTVQAPSRDLSSSPDLPLAAHRKLSTDKSPVKETHPEQPPNTTTAEKTETSPADSPPVPAPGTTDTHLPPETNTQPEPEPEPESAETNQNPPPGDAMEGIEHHPSPPAAAKDPSPITQEPAAPEEQPSEPQPAADQEANQEEASKEPSGTPAPASAPVHFEDGEVDLLGSLEASLEKGGGEKKEEKEKKEGEKDGAVDEGESADEVKGEEAQEEESKES